MTVHSVFIINKSGGLIYSKEYVRGSNLSSNDKLRLASTFHGLSAIATQIAPLPNSRGIDYVLADTLALHSYRSPTGTRFLIATDPSTVSLDSFFDDIYLLFSDYVMKNPFYELEMPIRCALFEEHLDRLVARQYLVY